MSEWAGWNRSSVNSSSLLDETCDISSQSTNQSILTRRSQSGVSGCWGSYCEEVVNLLQNQHLQISRLCVPFQWAQERHAGFSWQRRCIQAPLEHNTKSIKTWVSQFECPAEPRAEADRTEVPSSHISIWLQQWSNTPSNTPKPCGQPSQKSWSFIAVEDTPTLD